MINIDYGDVIIRLIVQSSEGTDSGDSEIIVILI